ncbi:hypothetical protein E2C01_077445 [Portunus trituberculatus]|uniref:Uncharacterized protein n=1 Tax=Portunus trituberculatus TaxID=210409 RepID=A0A5B7IK99_PORTR|nr:hypothetical protein [Portunus trituberculatus]
MAWHYLVPALALYHPVYPILPNPIPVLPLSRYQQLTMASSPYLAHLPLPNLLPTPSPSTCPCISLCFGSWLSCRRREGNSYLGKASGDQCPGFPEIYGTREAMGGFKQLGK